MRFNLKHVCIWMILSCSFFAFAQDEEKDDLGTQEITVVKSYSPSLKNVFKIRSNPSIDDSLVQKKQKVNYSFETIPVLSTFIPNKASPLKLQRQEPSIYQNAYVSAGFGNQSHPQLGFSSMVPLDRTQSIGFKFVHSSLAGIEGTILNSDQNRTTLDFIHQYKQNNMRVDSDLRYDRQGHNFFGIDDLSNIPTFRSEVVDPSQNLNYLSIRSRWQWYEEIFSTVNFDTHVTTDSYDSSEYIIKTNALINIPIWDQFIEIIPEIEWVNTSFVRGYYNEGAVDSKKGLSQVQLRFSSDGRKLKFKLGAGGYYPLGTFEETAQFYIYPKAEISYTTTNGKWIPFLKYEGSYDLNSFTSFSLENPYVAPTLEIESTQLNHWGVIGFKAYAGSGLSFTFDTSYSQSDNFPLFRRLPYDESNKDVGYRLGNTYQIIYDSIEKMGMKTQIDLRFSEYNKLSLQTGLYEYKRKGGKKVWNLPSLTIDLNANFRLGKKLFFQLGGHYIGARDSVQNILVHQAESEPAFETIASLSGVFSIASSITWKINSRWDLFYENNLILGDQTSRWAYYQNQSQLHLGGIRYKFDINL